MNAVFIDSSNKHCFFCVRYKFLRQGSITIPGILFLFTVISDFIVVYWYIDIDCLKTHFQITPNVVKEMICQTPYKFQYVH